MKTYQIFIFMIVSLFIAGCTSTSGGVNAQALIQANEQVDALLEEYPNASLDVTYYSVNESSQLEEEYNSICSKEFSQKALYRFSLQDESQNLDVVGYLNLDEQAVECLSREGNVDNNATSSSESSEATNTSNIDEDTISSNSTSSSLYYDIEAKFEGVEPTPEQKELLEELKNLTNSFNSTFKVEFKVEVEEDEMESREEGSVNSQAITTTWNELVALVKESVENSSEEVEVKIEIAKKQYEAGDDGGNSFEIKVESNREKRDDDVEIEIMVNEMNQTAKAEIEIDDSETVLRFNTTSIGDIKREIANEFDLEFSVVASNSNIEYESEEKEDESEEKKNEEIEIEVKVNENSQTSQAEIKYNDEEFNLEFDTTSLEEIKQEIASEFNVSYIEIASNTEIEYENEGKEDSDDELEDESSQNESIMN